MRKVYKMKHEIHFWTWFLIKTQFLNTWHALKYKYLIPQMTLHHIHEKVKLGLVLKKILANNLLPNYSKLSCKINLCQDIKFK